MIETAQINSRMQAMCEASYNFTPTTGTKLISCPAMNRMLGRRKSGFDTLNLPHLSKVHIEDSGDDCRREDDLTRLSYVSAEFTPF